MSSLVDRLRVDAPSASSICDTWTVGDTRTHESSAPQTVAAAAVYMGILRRAQRDGAGVDLLLAIGDARAARYGLRRLRCLVVRQQLRDALWRWSIHRAASRHGSRHLHGRARGHCARTGDAPAAQRAGRGRSEGWAGGVLRGDARTSIAPHNCS